VPASTAAHPKLCQWLLVPLLLLAFEAVQVWAVPVTTPPRVLILDETVSGGASSQEALAAQLAIPGCAVDVVSAANWTSIPGTGTGGPTGFGFDSYRAIIIGRSFVRHLQPRLSLRLDRAEWQ